jgi:hypothetical protein
MVPSDGWLLPITTTDAPLTASPNLLNTFSSGNSAANTSGGVTGS